MALHLGWRVRLDRRTAGGTPVEARTAISDVYGGPDSNRPEAGSFSRPAHTETRLTCLHLCMSLIDISQPLRPSTAVWPGDQSVEWSWTAQIDDQSAVNVGALRTSVHAGTHADAPLHVRTGGPSIDQIPLDVFVGAAHVVEVFEGPIRPQHVSAVSASRILFKTPYSDVDDSDWRPSKMFAVHPETIRSLAEQNAVLIGTDAPTVDPVESKDLPAHHALVETGIVNLENLRLGEVEPGEYELIALPMRLEGADAAPVRAALRHPE